MSKTLTTSVAFTDAQNNVLANGKVVFQLNMGAKLITNGQIVNVVTIPFTLDATGKLPTGQTINANDELQPTGTFYVVTIMNSNGLVVRGPENWILLGASPIDISTITSSSIPDPGLANPIIGNPSAPQTITGQPLTLTSSAPLNAASISACVENGVYVVGSSCYTTIAAACTAAGGTGNVLIPSTYAGADSVPNSCLGQIVDYRSNQTQIGPISSHFRVGQIIAAARPILDSGGALVPLGADLGIFAEGAADLSLGVQTYQVTSSTAVNAPGIVTITLSSGGLCGASPTNCLYPGNVGHSGASVWINKYQTDQETLSPRSTCVGLPVSTYCIASPTQITGNFAVAHTSTPYTVQQRGNVFFYNDQLQTLDTDNASSVFNMQHIGNSIVNRDWQICRGPLISSQLCTQKVIESGENGDHLPKFFGTVVSTSANIAQSGNIARMAATDCITWRNGNNNGDNCLQSNANNALLFGGTPIVFSATAGTDGHFVMMSGTTGYVIKDGGINTVTLKKGTGAGNYSSASTTFTAVDGTNLTNTVTIPTGWKLAIQVSGSITTSTAVATASVGINDGSCSGSTVNLQRVQAVPTAASNPESFSLSWVITGDGASHTINLCYLTSNGADSVTILNSAADLLPTMVFSLMPSS